MRYRVVHFLTGFSVLSLLFFVGCEGPAGPQGPQGDKGQNGQNILTAYNLEGFKDSIQCAMCHNADTDTTYRVAAKELQYEASLHGSGAEVSQNGNTCAGCHTNEGFYERYTRGFSNETFTLNAPSGPMCYQNYPDASRPGCFTCHAPHKRGNFTVRDSNAVNIFTLVGGQSASVWNSTVSSNLCVKCHQPRMTSTPFTSNPKSWQPDPSKTQATDTAKIYTARWNNHVSGEPTQTLLSIGGVEIPGNLSYTNSYHTTLVKNGTLGCPDCHMATAKSSNQNGGHTFAVRYLAEGSTSPSYNVNGCNVTGCHSGLAASGTDTHWGKRATIIAKIAELGKLMLDTTITQKWTLPQNGQAVPWVTLTTSTVIGDSTWGANASTTKPLVITPAFKAGALWNLQQVQYEKSHGMHNYQYVLALLQNSIDELKK